MTVSLLEERLGHEPAQLEAHVKTYGKQDEINLSGILSLNFTASRTVRK